MKFLQVRSYKIFPIDADDADVVAVADNVVAIVAVAVADDFVAVVAVAVADDVVVAVATSVTFSHNVETRKLLISIKLFEPSMLKSYLRLSIDEALIKLSSTDDPFMCS